MSKLTRGCCFLLAVAFAAVAGAGPLTQRGGRGGGSGEPPALDQEEILENFHRIVEVIMTDDEEDAWDGLDNDGQRETFIAEFWKERDPTPDSDVNEFQDIFMGRVAAAAGAFRDEGTEGYRTDRGKVFIVYGPAMIAQERRQGGGEFQVSDANAGEAVSGGGRGSNANFTYVWTMDAAINPFLEDKEELVFLPFQGTWPLSTRGLELSEEAFLANVEVTELFEARRANPSIGMAQPVGVEAGPTVEAVAMQELLDAGTTHSDLAVDQEFSFFPAPAGATYTVVAFQVGKDALTFTDGNAGAKAFGVILNGDDTLAHRFDAPFVVADDEGSDAESATYTFSTTLAPDQYRLAWGVVDGGSGKMRTVITPFEVPDLITDEISLSTVALAKSPIGQTQEPIDIERIYPHTRIGGFELDAGIDRVFDRQETMALLYFVLGVGVDSSTGQSQLEVEHRVLRAEDDQSIAKLPTETLQFAVIAQNIPLGAISQLEAGKDYKIQIHIKDLITGQELTHEEPFSVAPAGSD